MAKISIYTMRLEDLNISANHIKEVFLQKMKEEGLLTANQEIEMNRYRIFWKDEKDSLKITIKKTTE